MFPNQFFMFFTFSYQSLSQALAKLSPSRLWISTTRSCLGDGGENMRKMKNIKKLRHKHEQVYF